MTNGYRRTHDKLRPGLIAPYGELAVDEALRELKRLGLPAVTIYATPPAEAENVEIPRQVLEQMLRDLNSPFV